MVGLLSRAFPRPINPFLLLGFLLFRGELLQRLLQLLVLLIQFGDLPVETCALLLGLLDQALHLLDFAAVPCVDLGRLPELRPDQRRLAVVIE